MKIETFTAERWMDEHDSGIKYNLNDTCPDTLSLSALFRLCGVDEGQTMEALMGATLGYGPVRGRGELLEGLSSLYQSLTPEDFMTTHGATGGNHLAMYALVEPGDRIVSVAPTYQQLYSIPRGFLAHVDILQLTPEADYLPDPGQLARLAADGLKLICLNNPGNPTGALMPESLLREIVAIARRAGAYILCDEAYRGLNHGGEPAPSIADLYERGISVSSMSKAFSMPGLRLGWVASRDKAFMAACLERRDYNTITCGVLDEAVASLALAHKGTILARNLALLRQNLELLTRWVAEQPKLSWVRPRAGTTALLHYTHQIPSETLCLRLLRDTGVYLLPGDCFQVPGSLRVGFAGPTDVLQAGLARLGEYLSSL